jgi:hypothetical protein
MYTLNSGAANAVGAAASPANSNVVPPARVAKIFGKGFNEIVVIATSFR